jgi:hypothetical protein
MPKHKQPTAPFGPIDPELKGKPGDRRKSSAAAYKAMSGRNGAKSSSKKVAKPIAKKAPAKIVKKKLKK